jgi:hypothetical protein
MAATTGGNIASTVREILSNIGTSIDEMDLGEMYEIEGGAFNDLTVEKVREQCISIAHYTEMNGDAMRDPEAVLRLTDDGELVLVEFRQENGLSNRVEHDEEGIENAEIHSFLGRWANNLHDQGHVENAAEIEPQPA